PARRQRYIQLNITHKRSRMRTQQRSRTSGNECRLRDAANQMSLNSRHRRSRSMKIETTGDTATAVTASRRPICVCCAGAIETSPDQDMSLGLNVALGLVSDECA